MTYQETLDRYRKKFDESPPSLFWTGSDEGLQELMEKAIRDGKALTQEDLLKAQGIGIPPEGADL